VEDEWETDGQPLAERAAEKVASDFRNKFGIPAKALPLGVKPDPKPFQRKVYAAPVEKKGGAS
jgi:hypothetical protein